MIKSNKRTVNTNRKIHANRKMFLDRKKKLSSAVRFHGHLCLGQVLGVLIAEKGLTLASARDSHSLIVIGENDRCIADALQVITGTRLGRRSFKLKDYGRMAATFFNMNTNRAYRIFVRGNALQQKDYHNLSEREKEEYVDEVLATDIDDILGWEEVEVKFKPNELPGKPKIRVQCSKCGERVMDGKHRTIGNKSICIACSSEAYYTKKII